MPAACRMPGHGMGADNTFHAAICRGAGTDADRAMAIIPSPAAISM